MNTQGQAIVKTTGFDPLAVALDAIERDQSLQDSTKDQYTRAIENAAAAGVNLTDPQALNAYAATVGSSTRAFLSAVITKLTHALETQAKSMATPENVLDVQATIYRAEALREAVKIEKSKGHKAHTWLSQKEVKDLMRACEVRKSGNPETGIIAQRDKLALALLVGAGLRRSEAVNLTFENLKTQPVNGKARTVLNVHGKGAKDRIVPISDKLAARIRRWGDVVGHKGRILRSLGRNKTPGKSMSTTAVYNLVQKRGELMGREELEPHDLRRTYAQLGYEAGIAITQISRLLGHASVKTTQRYLNLELDLDTTISDFIPV
jgi:integrase